MNNKWFLSAAIIVLAFLGISLDKSTAVNQELVIQFSNLNVSPDDTEEAITLVKRKLEGLNIENITIHKSGRGKYSLAYYSNIDVSIIKKQFSQELEIAFEKIDYSAKGEFPKDPHPTDVKPFQLEIFKIQDADGVSSTKGAIFETKSPNTRFFTPDSFVFPIKYEEDTARDTDEVAYTSYYYLSLEIDKTSYQIPEVRAGPLV